MLDYSCCLLYLKKKQEKMCVNEFVELASVDYCFGGEFYKLFFVKLKYIKILKVFKISSRWQHHGIGSITSKLVRHIGTQVQSTHTLNSSSVV